MFLDGVARVKFSSAVPADGNRRETWQGRAGADGRRRCRPLATSLPLPRAGGGQFLNGRFRCPWTGYPGYSGMSDRPAGPRRAAVRIPRAARSPWHCPTTDSGYSSAGRMALPCLTWPTGDGCGRRLRNARRWSRRHGGSEAGGVGRRRRDRACGPNGYLPGGGWGRWPMGAVARWIIAIAVVASVAVGWVPAWALGAVPVLLGLGRPAVRVAFSLSERGASRRG